MESSVDSVTEKCKQPMSRDIYFLVDRIMQGYITKFDVDTITSHSEEERKCFQGPYGRYLLSLKSWIKMVVCEKRIL